MLVKGGPEVYKFKKWTCKCTVRHFGLDAIFPRWRHETIDSLHKGPQPVTVGFPSQRAGIRSLDVAFDVGLNKLLDKQLSCRWLRCHDAHVTAQKCKNIAVINFVSFVSVMDSGKPQILLSVSSFYVSTYRKRDPRVLDREAGLST